MENSKKIKQFLVSRNLNDIYLGIELLKSSFDADLISEILNGHSYLSEMIKFSMIPFFQDNPDIWESVKAKISQYQMNEIMKFMPHRILFLKDSSITAFCNLVNIVVMDYFNDFPLLNNEILKEETNCFNSYTLKGESIIDGFGWKFIVYNEQVGPAEVIQEDSWIAYAYNGKHEFLKFEYFQSGSMLSKMWMEKNF